LVELAGFEPASEKPTYVTVTYTGFLLKIGKIWDT
jgi:hypothetical protein